MIRHTPLREVVGTDLLRAVAAPHLAFSQRRLLTRLLLLLDLIQTRPEHTEGLFLVLQLGTLILAGDDDPGRTVRDPDRAGGLVDMLSAGTAGTIGVDIAVIRVEMDFHVIHLGHDGHGSRGGMDPAAGLRHGHALHAVDAALVL